MRCRLFTFAVLFSFISLGTNAAIPFPVTGDDDVYNTLQWNRQNLSTGKIDTGDWYEWWYYKVIDPETNNKYFFTYGIVNPWDTKGTSKHSRAFVAFGDFQQRFILEKEYAISQFKSSYETPLAIIGPNVGSDKVLIGSIEDDAHSVSWSFTIEKKVGWDAMGWGLNLPQFFNIYWHPAQMYAKFNGYLNVDGKRYLIIDADGYQDRNWGRVFPKWWFWMSINSFDENPESSFSGGGGDARTENGTKLPTAILLGLHHNDKLYEFRSSEPRYLFEWEMDLGQWKITATNLKYKLVVNASEDPKNMMDIPFHTPDGKTFHDYETLGGAAHIELYKRRPFFLGWKKIIDLSTQDKAGLEFGLDHPYGEPSGTPMTISGQQ